jgi:ubiquinone/menaquinone biosynthesis C-methylase UbiE
MLPRVLEPEVMDTELDALEYLAIDNSAVNREFADRVLALCPPRGRLLDVGTGPGDIAVLVAQSAPALHITAIDLGEHMLKLARDAVRRAGVADRVEVARADAKATGFADASFDMVISNSLVHHIPDPPAFLREVARVLRPGGALFIKDLLRPSSRTELDALVARYASDCSDYQRRLFHDSLHAALTVSEVADFCRSAALERTHVRQCSDRHWSIERVYQP